MQCIVCMLSSMPIATDGNDRARGWIWASYHKCTNSYVNIVFWWLLYLRYHHGQLISSSHLSGLYPGRNGNDPGRLFQPNFRDAIRGPIGTFMESLVVIRDVWNFMVRTLPRNTMISTSARHGLIYHRMIKTRPLKTHDLSKRCLGVVEHSYHSETKFSIVRGGRIWPSTSSRRFFGWWTTTTTRTSSWWLR